MLLVPDRLYIDDFVALGESCTRCVHVRKIASGNLWGKSAFIMLSECKTMQKVTKKSIKSVLADLFKMSDYPMVLMYLQTHRALSTLVRF